MLFDSYASTKDPSATKGKLLPLMVSDSPGNIFDSIKKYLEENGYSEITGREEFYDLFGVKEQYEVSFNIAPFQNKSVVQISVYSEKKKGRVKRRLKQIYAEMEARFERYM